MGTKVGTKNVPQSKFPSLCALQGRVFLLAVCVQMFLSCQMALGAISRRYLRGGTRRVIQRHLCFLGALGQSAQAEKILPSCTVANKESI